MKIKYCKYATLALAGYLLTGCGGSSNSEPDPVTPPPPAETNAAPVAVADSALVADNTITSINVLENDTDVDEDALTITEIVTPPNFGTAAIVDNAIEFTPQQNFAGTDTLTYRISDGELTADAELSLSLTQSLTLSGRVDGLGETTATLNILIGDEVVSFEADADGAYEVAITLTDSGQLPQLNAVDEEQQPVLVSLPGGAEALIEASGDDRVLSADENTAVNLNLLSTAFFLLSEDANNNQPIQNTEMLAEINASLNTTDIVDVAAFIQVLTTNAEFAPGTGSTSALIQAVTTSLGADVFAILDNDSFQTTQEAIQQYLVDNNFVDELGDPAAEYLVARDQAILQITSSNPINSDFTSVVTSLLNQPIVMIPAQQSGFVASIADTFTLDESGTGRFFSGFNFTSGAIPSVPLTWEVTTEGQLALSFNLESSSFLFIGDFTLEFITEEFGEEVADFIRENPEVFEFQTIELIDRTTGQNISLLRNNANNLQVITETRTERELVFPAELDFGPNPLTNGQSSIDSFNVPTQVNSVLADAEQSEISGTWAIPIIADLVQIQGELDQRVTEILTLNDSGSSTGVFSGTTYDWAFSDGVISLENESERYEYIPFRLNGDEFQSVMTRFIDGEMTDQQLVVMALFNDTASQFTNNLVTEIPEIYTSHINSVNPRNWLGDTLRVSAIFGHQFNEDDTMRRAISVFDTDSFNFTSDSWILVDNQVQIRRNFTSFLAGRDWEVISVDETGRALVIETLLVNQEFSDSPFASPPRLNSFTLLDLSLYPETLNNSDFTQGLQPNQAEEQLSPLDQIEQK
jgi:hypothetical protein